MAIVSIPHPFAACRYHPLSPLTPGFWRFSAPSAFGAIRWNPGLLRAIERYAGSPARGADGIADAGMDVHAPV
jgi:hypothetical protein